MSDDTLQRLGALPRKVAVPMRRLWDAGRIIPQHMQMLLDAAECGGNIQHVLGAAPGLIRLENRRIPVAETVGIASSIGKPVRLDWTAEQWQSAREMMLRAQRYHAARADDCRYDLSAFDRRLAADYPGGLIRSRSRLAAVAARIGHPIDDWHKDIVAGTHAFACVFRNRKRWTVRLRRLGQRRILLEEAYSPLHSRRSGWVSPATLRDMLQCYERRVDELTWASAMQYICAWNVRQLLDHCAEYGVRTIRAAWHSERGILDAVDNSIVYHPAPPEDRRIVLWLPDPRLWSVAKSETLIERFLMDVLQQHVENWAGKRRYRKKEVLPPSRSVSMTVDVPARTMTMRYGYKFGRRHKPREEIMIMQPDCDIHRRYLSDAFIEEV